MGAKRKAEPKDTQVTGKELANSYFPKLDSTYIPFPSPTEPPTIEYVKEHGVVVTGNGEVGCAETHKDGVVYLSRVFLNPDGSIAAFHPRPVNKYVRVVEIKMGIDDAEAQGR